MSNHIQDHELYDNPFGAPASELRYALGIGRRPDRSPLLEAQRRSIALFVSWFIVIFLFFYFVYIVRMSLMMSNIDVLHPGPVLQAIGAMLNLNAPEEKVQLDFSPNIETDLRDVITRLVRTHEFADWEQLDFKDYLEEEKIHIPEPVKVAEILTDSDACVPRAGHVCLVRQQVQNTFKCELCSGRVIPVLLHGLKMRVTVTVRGVVAAPTSYYLGVHPQLPEPQVVPTQQVADRINAKRAQNPPVWRKMASTKTTEVEKVSAVAEEPVKAEVEPADPLMPQDKCRSIPTIPLDSKYSCDTAVLTGKKIRAQTIFDITGDASPLTHDLTMERICLSHKVDRRPICERNVGLDKSPIEVVKCTMVKHPHLVIDWMMTVVASISALMTIYFIAQCGYPWTWFQRMYHCYHGWFYGYPGDTLLGVFDVACLAACAYGTYQAFQRRLRPGLQEKSTMYICPHVVSVLQANIATRLTYKEYDVEEIHARAFQITRRIPSLNLPDDLYEQVMTGSRAYFVEEYSQNFGPWTEESDDTVPE